MHTDAYPSCEAAAEKLSPSLDRVVRIERTRRTSPISAADQQMNAAGRASILKIGWAHDLTAAKNIKQLVSTVLLTASRHRFRRCRKFSGSLLRCLASRGMTPFRARSGGVTKFLTLEAKLAPRSELGVARWDGVMLNAKASEMAISTAAVRDQLAIITAFQCPTASKHARPCTRHHVNRCGGAIINGEVKVAQ